MAGNPPVALTDARALAPSVVAGAPDAPRLDRAVPGANSVALHFSHPAYTGSSPIVLVTGICTDGTFRFVASSATSPVVVSGLTQLTDYRCTVNAINAELSGPDSAAVTVNLAAPPAFTGKASAPRELSIVPGDQSLTVSFAPPLSDGGFPIIGYTVNCAGGAGAGASAVASPAIVAGLTNGRAYTCSVAAFNAQGAGASTASITATPLASLGGPRAPGPMGAVSVTPGNARATFDFVAPVANGAAVQSYGVVCSAPTSRVVGAALDAPLTVSGLRNGVAYSCAVSASNAYGTSAPSVVNVTPLATLINRIEAPLTVALTATVPSLAADGVSGIIASVRTLSGALYAGDDLSVNFQSGCGDYGLAALDASAPVVNGVAVATYQPRGCNGVDTVTATLSGTSTVAKARVAVDARPMLSARAALGKRFFFDVGLSASGTQSCASCHAPAHNYFAPNLLATQPGGRDGRALGFRSAPSAAYAALATPFRFLPATNQQGSVDNTTNGKLGTPRAGLMADGRETDVFGQARGPFISPHEMANADSAEVRTRLLTRPYLADYVALYGAVSAGSNPDTVLTNMADAIARFETEDRSFAPFNSKFDAVAAGLASFSAQEANGQLLFTDPNKAACIGCHTPFSQARAAQAPAAFTDGGYRATGVPRNWALPYNIDTLAPVALNLLGLNSLMLSSAANPLEHLFFDLGFCGPFRTDSLLDAPLCGQFRTPGLRNIAVKGSYFHNGAAATLYDVIDFYVNRDTAPERIYRKADGSPDVRYNDLPAKYQANIVQRPPFTASPGVRLSPTEVQDLVAYLCTFTDGYDPANPDAYWQPRQCVDATRRVPVAPSR